MPLCDESVSTNPAELGSRSVMPSREASAADADARNRHHAHVGIYRQIEHERLAVSEVAAMRQAA